MPGVRARPLSGLLVSSSEDAPSSGGRNTSNSMSPLPHNQRRSYLTYFRPAAGKSGDGVIALSCLTALFVVGTILGFVLPSSDELHGPYRRISAVIGWTYFCSWSVSFYPQVLLNFQRKTSVGVSFDFLLYNVLAFSCYAAFTCSLFWWKSVQDSYDRRHAGQPNKVQLNDAVFALHAVFISSVTLSQAMFYDWRNGKQRPSFAAVIFCCGVIGVSSVYALVVALDHAVKGGDNDGLLSWLDFLYFLSYVKVGTSILKYVPQVVLNARRRSTKGWTIWNVILDFTGGLLSILQLILDCWNTGDWSGIRGYPVKFAIGFVSVVFDIIFMFQHYILYPQHPIGGRREGLPYSYCSSSESSAPLLDTSVQGGGGGTAAAAETCRWEQERDEHQNGTTNKSNNDSNTR